MDKPIPLFVSLNSNADKYTDIIVMFKVLAESGLYDLNAEVTSSEITDATGDLYGNVYQPTILTYIIRNVILEELIVPLVEILLENGASPNTTYGENNTPLISALINNRFKTVDMLLNCPDINVSKSNPNGIAPIFFTVMVSNEDTAMKYLNKLIEMGVELAELNVQEPQRQLSLLMYAIYKRHFKIAEKLVDLNVDLTLTNKYNQTAYDMIRLHSNTPSVKQIIEKMNSEMSKQSTDK